MKHLSAGASPEIEHALTFITPYIHVSGKVAGTCYFKDRLCSRYNTDMSLPTVIEKIAKFGYCYDTQSIS